MAEIQSKYSRRTIALFLLVVIGIFIGTLVAYQQIAFLYVAATLFLVVLLLVVAFSDLEKVGDEGAEGT